MSSIKFPFLVFPKKEFFYKICLCQPSKFLYMVILKRKLIPKKEIEFQNHQKIAYVSHQNFLL